MKKRKRLGDEHIGNEWRERYRFAEKARDLAGTDAGAVDEKAARHLEGVGAHLEAVRGAHR